jgi:hypothetical protein
LTAGLLSRPSRRDTSSATSPRDRRASASRRCALCSIFFISGSVNRVPRFLLPAGCLLQAHAWPRSGMLINKLDAGAFKGSLPLVHGRKLRIATAGLERFGARLQSDEIAGEAVNDKTAPAATVRSVGLSLRRFDGTGSRL